MAPPPPSSRPSSSRRRPLDKAAAVVEGAGDGLADGIDRHGLQHSAPHLAATASDLAQRNSRSERLRARLEKVDDKVSSVLEATKDKARAVAETARRARTVPPAVARDLGRAGRSYVGGYVASLGLFAAAGVVAIAALVLVTVGLVQAGENAWGEPWGALAVALGYLVVAGICAAAARGRIARGKQEARARVEVARTEMRHVTEPLRQAFGRDGGAPARPPRHADGAGLASHASHAGHVTPSTAPQAAFDPSPPPRM